MPLNLFDAGSRIEASCFDRRGGTLLVGTIIKFPDEGRIVRFGSGSGESATIIILPVIRIERHGSYAEGLEVEPTTQPPTENGSRRRVRRR